MIYKKCPCSDDGCRVHMPPIEDDEGSLPYPTDCGRGAIWCGIFDPHPHLACFGYKRMFFPEQPANTWQTTYETVFTKNSFIADDEINQVYVVERTTSKNIHLVSDPCQEGNKWTITTKIDGR